MNAPMPRAALQRRQLPPTMPAFNPPAVPNGLTLGHIDIYRRCLGGLLHMAGQAVAVQAAERDLNRCDLLPATEHIRAHCALGIERIYRLMSDDSIVCDINARAERLKLRAEAGRALGF